MYAKGVIVLSRSRVHPTTFSRARFEGSTAHCYHGFVAFCPVECSCERERELVEAYVKVVPNEGRVFSLRLSERESTVNKSRAIFFQREEDHLEILR